MDSERLENILKDEKEVLLLQQMAECRHNNACDSYMTYHFAIGEYRVCPYERSYCMYNNEIAVEGHWGKKEVLYRCNYEKEK